MECCEAVGGIIAGSLVAIKRVSACGGVEEAVVAVEGLKTGGCVIVSVCVTKEGVNAGGGIAVANCVAIERVRAGGCVEVAFQRGRPVSVVIEREI